MLKNLWSQVRYFCMEHETPVPFVEDVNRPQYVCACHYKKDDEHPDGYTDVRCDAILRYKDCTAITEKLSAIVEKDMLEFAEADYTGKRLNYKLIEAKVLRQSDRHIDIGIRSGGTQ